MNTQIKHLGFALFLSLAFACNKTEKTGNSDSKNPQEVSLEQETLELKDQAGKSVFVTYFAKGDQVAVRIKIDGKDHEMVAKGINKSGNPIFTDGEYAWEMGADSHNGKLTDKANKTTPYAAD